MGFSTNSSLINAYFTNIIAYADKTDDDRLIKIEQNINYGTISQHDARNGVKLLIADLNTMDQFSAKNEFAKVVFSVSESQVISSNIVTFTKPTNNDRDIIAAILNFTFDAKNYMGKISMYDIAGNLLFFNEATNGKIISSGYVKPKTSGTSKWGRVAGCIDWYLVTYSGGVLISESFLYTSCDCGGNTSGAPGGRINCDGGGGGVPGNGPNPPPNPRNGDRYTHIDKDGIKREYIANNNVWSFIAITLSPVAVTAQANQYGFLGNNDSPPNDRQQIKGPDTFVYTYSIWAGTWFGASPAEIDDFALRPCMQAILNRLRNGDQVPWIINKFSGQEKDFNWKVQDGRLGDNINAQTQNYDRINRTATTTFDTDKFANATDLSIVRTILHESVHAYLVTYFASDPIRANEEYPYMVADYMAMTRPDLNQAQHNEMVESFISDIASALKIYGQSQNYVITDDYYFKLAWGGLTNTDAFRSYPQDLQDTTKEVILIELTGHSPAHPNITPVGTAAGCN